MTCLPHSRNRKDVELLQRSMYLYEARWLGPLGQQAP